MIKIIIIKLTFKLLKYLRKLLPKHIPLSILFCFVCFLKDLLFLRQCAFKYHRNYRKNIRIKIKYNFHGAPPRSTTSTGENNDW